MELDLILSLVAGLVGLPILWSVVVDILKYTGVVNDGTAGKWFAAFNLLSLVAVAVLVNFFPDVDIAGIDARLVEIGKFASLVLVYALQLLGGKAVHALTAKAIPSASFSN